MKIFIDSEFIENGVTIDLISIGLVDETGDELYLISSEFDESKASDWVRENVLSKLASPLDVRRYPKKQIAEMVRGFMLMNDTPPEVWGYYSDYDWVLLCQLFGRMIDLPRGMPYWCRDLKQLATELHVVLPQPAANEEHHALADARWIAKSHAICESNRGPFIIQAAGPEWTLLGACNTKREVRDFLATDPAFVAPVDSDTLIFKGKPAYVSRVYEGFKATTLQWKDLQ